MTQAEINDEVLYRVKERLSILADGHSVEPHYYDIANAEAEEWLQRQKAQQQFWWNKE